jgi:excisionase family DNA binding protein
MSEQNKISGSAVNSQMRPPADLSIPPKPNLVGPTSVDNFTAHLPQAVFTVPQVSWALQVTPKTVYRLVARGKLRALPAIRHVRITRRSLEQFLANASK